MACSKAEHVLTSKSAKIRSFNSVERKKKKEKTRFGLKFLMRKNILKKEKRINNQILILPF